MRQQGIPVEVVIVADDVALRNLVARDRCRGIAGTVLVHKLAGAAAERGLPLSEVAGIARNAAGALGSMGVELGACIVPSVGKPGFEIGEDEIEFGLGIHGEKGVERTTIQSADQIVTALLDSIVAAWRARSAASAAGAAPTWCCSTTPSIPSTHGMAASSSLKTARSRRCSIGHCRHATAIRTPPTDPAQKAEARGTAGGVRVDFRDAFHLATAGGGAALGLPVGRFSPGYNFDAILVDAAAPNGTIRLWDEFDGGDGILQKIVYSASRANIASVWVGGRLLSQPEVRLG